MKKMNLNMKKIGLKSEIKSLSKSNSFSKIAKKIIPIPEKPDTTQRMVGCLFEDFNPKYDLFKINENTYSFCMEYTDISFSQSSKERQVNIFLKWVEYLNSFTEHTHIQITNAGKSLKTNDYKKSFLYDENHKDPNLKRMAQEINAQIEKDIGHDDYKLESKRYITVSQRARSYEEAHEIFLNILTKTESKFHQLKSAIRIVPCSERLDFIYDFFHIDTVADHKFVKLADYAQDTNQTIYDVLAPKKLDYTQKNYAVIDDKKYVQILYIDKYPKSLTPRFYNRLTTLDLNLITTLNINPTNAAKTVKKIQKKLSGMDTERYEKIKSAANSKVPYEYAPDRKLEKKISDIEQLDTNISKNKQKIFQNNMLICVMADSVEELTNNRIIITELATEHHISLRPILWKQHEGIMNLLPLGHNTIQFQRSLTSESTAINVPFNSKDLLQPHSIYYGRNLTTKNSIFCDRKQLLNGNGCILATSGSGKSFLMKLNIEMIRMVYPQDEIIIIDPQNEYNDVIDALHGQTIKISTSSHTHINPFDLDLNYSLSEDKTTDPVSEKIDYIIAFVESITEQPLSGVDKTIIDRCAKRIFKPYTDSGFKDKSLLPNLKNFYEDLLLQPERQAQQLAIVVERYVTGSIDMFAKDTDIDIKNSLISFDISELKSSMLTTGYLVVLDFIMNRLATNKHLGKWTWIFVDEFHILLKNFFSAEYMEKIYKVGRKFHALPTVCTQNISEVLKSDFGCNILSLSEFAIMLKQKILDLTVLSQIFSLSEEEADYVRDSPSGQGLLMYGEDCYPFYNDIPKDTYIYNLNETSSLLKTRC